MALRTIVTEPDEMLRKKSREVTNFNERIHQLLDDMKDTMYESNGVGLAAVQVGVLRRVVVIDVEDEHGCIELINPEIIHMEGEQDGREGCLSFPGKMGYVKRPMTVTFRAQDRNGEWYEMTGEGMFARCVCHELDHLDGVVFLDTARDVTEMTDEDFEEYEYEE